MAQSTYRGNAFSAWAPNYGFTTQCTGIKYTKLAPGFYSCTDLLAGWYDQVRGFRATYSSSLGCMTGYVSLDNNGVISLISSHINAWGDELDYLENGLYDPETGTISYTTSYAGSLLFEIVLNKANN